MNTARAEALIQKVVAILVAVLSFTVFIPVGGLFYIFLLVRATVSLTLSSFISAMTGIAISANVQQLLHHSVSFFPTGLAIIWSASKAIWRGENFGSSERRSDSLTLLTNIILAILFFVVLTMILNALGWSGIRVSAIISWFFGTPILLLLFLALLAIAYVWVRPVLNEALRRRSSTETK